MSYDHGCQVLLQQRTTCPSWSSYSHMRVKRNPIYPFPAALASSNSSCKARAACSQSRSLTTKAKLSSEDPCVIIMTLMPCFATAPNTLAATPLIPRMPDPTTAMTATSSLTFICFMTFPSRLSSKVVIALSRSVFLTSIEMLDSEGLCDIIIMLMRFLARVSNILAAVPGAPTIPPPLTSMRAVWRMTFTDLTIFCDSLLGFCVMIVPLCLTLNVLRILIGILVSMTGSSARGCMYFAPKSAISMASANDTSLSTFALMTSLGSAVISPSTSLHNHTSLAPMLTAIIVAV